MSAQFPPRTAALTLAAAALLTPNAARADVPLAEDGRARSVLVVQPGATPAERHAAAELAATLQQITGATFETREAPASGETPDAAVIVGPGPAARRYFPEVDLAAFGEEQVTLRTKGGRLLLAGGRPRGTLYAAYRLLQDRCGVRWWTPWASTVPTRRTLTLPDMTVNAAPAFESRDPFWYPAFNGDWAARNFSNSQSANLAEKHGGKVVYKGFVHTFFPLVPPEKHFAAHPEWYSLIDGKRTAERGQLCTTNPDLRAEVVARVRDWLRESPDARIVSVSQNDWYGACQCPVCKAVDEREGSPAGTMLSLANHVAGKIGPEFPHVAIDTLAYQYTRKAPRTVTPLPNVIVRLCSIEANFGAPLEDPSNRAFADDLRDWSRVSKRLYVWDYTTNFAHYPLPHPNWYSLGPNVRFFHRHGVRGLFEQGAYQSHGGEMSEMRAWVLARLLWDPYQDDRKLIREFLEGYYGKPASGPIGRYLDLLTRKAKGFYLTCYNSPSAPYLDFATLVEAEKLWQQAEAAAKDNPDHLWRVRQGHLPVRYAFLQQWPYLRREARKAGAAAWPLSPSRKAVADEWLAVATGPGPAGWSPMTHVSESGLTPQAFVARYAADPPEPPTATRDPLPPADVELPAGRSGVEAQDDLARLISEGVWIEARHDPLASDGVAARMPGNHREWAFQMRVADLDKRAHSGKWKVYVSARVETKGGSAGAATAFSAGVYDGAARKDAATLAVPLSETKPDAYRSYLIGTVTLNRDQYLWAAPPADPNVTAVWIDRFYLVPVD